MPEQAIIAVVAVTLVLLIIGGQVLFVMKAYRRVAQGRALIVNKMGTTPHVSFSGMVVYPYINTAEELDLTMKILSVEASGREALVAKDGARVDVRMLFYVRINQNEEDVLRVAQTHGCAAASDPKRVQELFSPKFLEAMKVVTAHFDADELAKRRMEYKDRVIEVVGMDLNGFRLDDVVVEQLDVRPK